MRHYWQQLIVYLMRNVFSLLLHEPILQLRDIFTSLQQQLVKVTCSPSSSPLPPRLLSYDGRLQQVSGCLKTLFQQWISLLKNYWNNRVTSWMLYIFVNFETTAMTGKLGMLALADRRNIGGSDSDIGHRKMHRYLQYLQSKWMICRCEDVRVAVKKLAPEGVCLRRKRSRQISL